MDFISQFKAASRVSTPLVAIRTFDTSSAVSAIKNAYKKAGCTPCSKDTCVDHDLPFVAWDCMQGCYPYNSAGKKGLTSLLGSKPKEATIKLTNTLAYAADGWGLEQPMRDCMLFLSNPHFFFNDPGVIQGIWNLRNIFKANGHMLVLLIAPGAVLPKELVNDVLILDEPLPTREKLAEIVINNHKLHKAPEPTGTHLEKAVDAVVGLPAFGAEQSVAMCISGKTKELDMDELWHKKREIINQTPGLAVLTPKLKLAQVGGNEQVVKFYRQLFEGPRRPSLIIFMDEIEKMFAGTGSQDGNKAELAGAFQSWCEDNNIRGGALVGIPGVGKTLLFEALCGEYEVPGIKFDVAAMQDKHVGESGARLRNAMATVLSVSGNMGASILALATSNGMDNMPLGLRSRFGFAPTFFFDEPRTTEKQQIWKIQGKKYNLNLGTLPNDDHWTGREIKQCCEKAEALGISVFDASQWVIPVTVSEKDRINDMRASAHEKYLSASVTGPYQHTEVEDHKELVIATEMEGRRIKE